jgi:hypothetical protein
MLDVSQTVPLEASSLSVGAVQSDKADQSSAEATLGSVRTRESARKSTKATTAAAPAAIQLERSAQTGNISRGDRMASGGRRNGGTRSASSARNAAKISRNLGSLLFIEVFGSLHPFGQTTLPPLIVGPGRTERDTHNSGSGFNGEVLVKNKMQDLLLAPGKSGCSLAERHDPLRSFKIILAGKAAIFLPPPGISIEAQMAEPPAPSLLRSGIANDGEKPCFEGRSSLVASPALEDFLVSGLQDIPSILEAGGTTADGPAIAGFMVQFQLDAKIRITDRRFHACFIMLIHLISASSGQFI